MNSSRIFWGLLIILIGFLWLLGNMGVLPADFWVKIWKLWPILLIIWGATLLFSKEGRVGWWVSGFGIILIIAFAALLGWWADLGELTKIETTSISEQVSPTAEEGIVNIKYGAADLNLSADGDKFIKGEIVSYGKTGVVKSESQKVMKVEIDQNIGSPSIWHRGFKNSLDLQLGTRLPYTINLDTGASKFDFDLEKIKAKSLNINSGATSGDIKIGSLVSSVEVDISCGASSFNVLVPKNAGIKVTNKSGLSSINYSALGLEKKDVVSVGESVYANPVYDSAEVKIELSFSAGASSINFQTY